MILFQGMIWIINILVTLKLFGVKIILSLILVLHQFVNEFL